MEKFTPVETIAFLRKEEYDGDPYAYTLHIFHRGMEVRHFYYRWLHLGTDYKYLQIASYHDSPVLEQTTCHINPANFMLVEMRWLDVTLVDRIFSVNELLLRILNSTAKRGPKKSRTTFMEELEKS